ncbi:MAG: hypothetical protein U0269_11460 [Polyangiales bacterium]
MDVLSSTDPSFAQPATVEVADASYRQASSFSGPTFHAPTDAPIALWWGLWVASKVLARIGAQQADSSLRGAALIARLMTDTLWDAAYSAMTIASAIVAILVVSRVDARMRAHGKTMGAPVTL